MATRTASKKQVAQKYSTLFFRVNEEEMARLRRAVDRDQTKRRLVRPNMAGFIRIAALDAADALLAEGGA